MSIFTFGFGHECKCGRGLGGHYTVVEPDPETGDSARDRMYKTWARKWAFEYPTKEDAGVERWGIKEVITNFTDPTRCPCGQMDYAAAVPVSSEISE